MGEIKSHEREHRIWAYLNIDEYKWVEAICKELNCSISYLFRDLISQPKFLAINPASLLVVMNHIGSEVGMLIQSVRLIEASVEIEVQVSPALEAIIKNSLDGFNYAQQELEMQVRALLSRLATKRC